MVGQKRQKKKKIENKMNEDENKVNERWERKHEIVTHKRYRR